MPRVLGVSCTPSCCYLALLVDGKAEPKPEILEWPVGERSERLSTLFDDIIALLGELQVDGAAILLPERDPRLRWNYATVAPRLALETLIRLAAVRAGIPVEMIDRKTVRSRLGFSGPLDHQVEIVVARTGKCWREGRGLAALAALTFERA